MLKNRTISSILRYCKTKPRFLDIVTKTALFQNRTNQGRVIPRPYCICLVSPLHMVNVIGKTVGYCATFLKFYPISVNQN